MNRKLVVCCTVLSVILFAAIGWFFYHHISSASRVAEDSESDIPAEVLRAVPMDAVVIYQTNSISDADGIISLFASECLSAVSSLPGGGADLKGSVSLHATGKNKVSALIVCAIPQTMDGKSIENNLIGRCEGVMKKNYDSAVIYCSSVSHLNFSVFGNYLLCSSSIPLIESSIRLLGSGESLLDNTVFLESVKDRSTPESIAINHNVIGKLLSDVARPQYRKFTAFLSHVTDWSFFSLLRTAPGELSGIGTVSRADGRSRYISVFNGQYGGKSDLTEILPYNTECYTSIRISDLEGFISGYSGFKSSLGRKRQNDDDLISVAKDAGVREVAMALVRLPHSTERIVLLKADKPEYFCRAEEGSDTCAFPQAASAVAGKFFSVPAGSFCCRPASGWVMMGSPTAIEWYLKTSGNVNFFPLSDWLSQTPVRAAPGRGTVISSMVNVNMISDSLGTVLNEKYAVRAASAVSEYNFNYITFSVNADNGRLVPAITVYTQNLEKLPSLKAAVVESASEVSDVNLSVPEGPYEIVDFRTGKKNTLEQLPHGGLQLKNEKGKSLWTIPFDGRICGCVSQIDYLKNNKLQMLMASGSKLYLLTRLGGDVKPFPVETGKEILYGPAVYDLKSDRDYLFVVLHSDNTVAFYDRNGNTANGYGQITAPEKIVKIPEPLETGGTLCWVVRTAGQTIIVGSDGIPVANFNRKRRLAPDTEIKIISDDELQVTSVEGKSYILNLTTGEFSKK